MGRDLKKVHIHTSCRYFAGCENMIAVLLGSVELKKSIRFSLSYHYSDEYEKGLRLRVPDLNIDVFPLHLFPHNLNTSKVISLIYMLFHIPMILFDIVKMVPLFKKINPDILYINNGGFPASRSCHSAVFAARIAGIKEIYFCVNNIAVPYKRIRRKLCYLQDQMVKKRVTNFLTASKYAGDKLADVLKLNREEVLHYYNSFVKMDVTEKKKDLRERLGVFEDDIFIYSAGLYEERKGFHYLIEAMHILKKELGCSNAVLVMTGKGAYEASLKALVKKLDLNDSVKILSNVDNIYNFYNAADIFSLNSFAYDDLPFVVKEAMCMGLPIVATNFAGFPEMVETGKNGILVDVKSPEQIADALHKLIVDKNLRERFGVESKYKYNQLFSAEATINEYKKLFKVV